MRRTVLSSLLLISALSASATSAYAMGDAPTISGAVPQVTRTVSLQLADNELKTDTASVVVNATIDAVGYPRHIVIAKSGGELVDERAIAAVSQYRFAPSLEATPVSITITIHK